MIGSNALLKALGVGSRFLDVEKNAGTRLRFGSPSFFVFDSRPETQRFLQLSDDDRLAQWNVARDLGHASAGLAVHAGVTGSQKKHSSFAGIAELIGLTRF